MAKGKNGAFRKKAARFRAASAAASTSAPALARAAGSNSATRQPRREPGMDCESDAQKSGTTMQEVARNTTNKTTHWDQGTRLRDKPVSFVSGGFVEPLEELGFGLPAVLGTVREGVLATETKDVEAITENLLDSPVAKLASNACFEESTSNLRQTTPDIASDSSEEVILFKGRERHRNTRPNKPSNVVAVTTFSNPKLQYRDTYPAQLECSDRFDLLASASDNETASTAAIDDYIANLLLDDLEDTMRQTQANRRELGGSDTEIVIDAARSDDKDDLVSRQVFDSGAEELSSRDDQTDDGSNEEQEDDAAGYGENTDSEENGNHSEALDESWQSTTAMDDEQLATLLAKQEELGLRSDDLVLFDSNSTRMYSRGRGGLSSKQTKRSKGRTSWMQKVSLGCDFTKDFRASDGSCPSAEAVADAFEQFEVTKWTSHRDDVRLGLSDSELEATLRASWQKDRLRKKERKQAREELRVQGLLRKNADPNDPRVKYPNGMGLDDIKAEFQLFLLGSEDIVTFPPMDAHARKIIHELAHRFNITSKSTGSGNQRRPTLVRKKATAKFDEGQFQGVFARVGRHYFTRLDRKSVGTGASRRASGNSGRWSGNTGAATVRNGEVVGGSAPEIGQANKGRAMLEKMGWSMGMALGALDNKGRTQPIEHVVKRSKAGLG